MKSRRRTLYPVQWFFGLLSAWLTPQMKPQPRKLVLTSFHGDGYRGNTRILFENWVKRPDAEVVWLTRNPQLCAELSRQYGVEKVCLQHSFRGLRELGQAQAIFLTHGTSDFAFLRLPRHAAIIQTYHGLPTKRGEYMRPNSDAPPGWFHRKVLEYRFQPLTHFLSSSRIVSDIFSRRFGLPLSRFRQTGYPMYAPLMYPNAGKPAVLQQLGVRTGDDAPLPKVILYAPTYRRRARTRWFPFQDFSPEKLRAFLDAHNALLCLRPHPNDLRPDPGLLRISARIILADQQTIEQTEVLLMAADAIITDYSSIYLEGLLRGIPPVFIPYDRDSYERGMPLPYDDVTPGPHVGTMASFLNALEEALAGAPKYRQERERVRGLFFEDQHEDAVERVFSFLEDEVFGENPPSG